MEDTENTSKPMDSDWVKHKGAEGRPKERGEIHTPRGKKRNKFSAHMIRGNGLTVPWYDQMSLGILFRGQGYHKRF